MMTRGWKSAMFAAVAVALAFAPASEAQLSDAEAKKHIDRIFPKGLPGDGGGHLELKEIEAFGTRLDMTLDLNIQFVPEPHDLEILRREAKEAQMLLCDATDGQLSLRKLEVHLGRAAADHSDIWWRRSTTEDAAFAGQYVVMTAPAGNVLAHELGHYVLKLVDSYPMRTEPGCGFGPAYEEPNLTDVSNTIMQDKGQRVCTNANRTHPDVNPAAFDRPLYCHTDADCPAPNAITDPSGNSVSGSWVCESMEPLGSEFGTRDNQDSIMGDFKEQAPMLPAGASWNAVCPDEGSEAGEVALEGHLTNPTRDTCGDGDLDATEECGDDGTTTIACDMTGRPGAANMSGTASCVSCRWDTSSCTLDTCGNGETDPNEDCDPSDSSPPAQPTCEDLAAGAPLGVGDADEVVGCHTNCTYDISVCPHAASPGLVACSPRAGTLAGILRRNAMPSSGAPISAAPLAAR